ncbi:hypothetical protein, partial [Flavobacterium taihuense]
FENFIFRFLLVFLAVFQGTLRILRGAKVNYFFKSHKLFEIFFLKINLLFFSSLLVSIIKNLVAVAGAKVAPLFV